MLPRIRHVLLGLTVGFVVAALLTVLRRPTQGLELKSLDARFRAFHDPARADTSIVIIDVDNHSLALLRGSLGRFPWRREAWAWVIRYAAAGQARAIVFDFTFPEPDLNHPADDSAFGEATRAAGNVVHTVFVQRYADVDTMLVEEPMPLVRDAARMLGVIEFTPDSADGTLRRVPLRFATPRRTWPTLGLAAVLVADSARIAADTGTIVVNWRGPYRAPGTAHPETYRIYPAAQILNSYHQLSTGVTPEVSPDAFRDKIVFIGSSGAGLFEARANPFGPSDPGVLIHATVADNLLHHDPIRVAPAAANTAALFAVALAAGLLVALIGSAWLSASAGLLLLVIYVGAAFALFARADLWIDVARPVMAVILTFTGGMSLNYMTEGRRKRQIRDMFSKYVAPEYVAQLAENPASLNLSGQRAELSILFSDIRGFTSISESMEPHQVIEFLNEYLTKMAAIVTHSGGTLDKFIGDAVMAFWGEPVRHADHADRAADCALAMRDATAELARQWVAQGKPDIRIGIGINTAEVVVGNIGSLEHKLDYTVIGDGVNLASRLEGLNKDFGTTIIISEAARARLGDRFEVRPLGDVKVKGKERPLPIFELLGRRAGGAALLLLALAGTLPAQQSQWSDAVYVPGRWTQGRIVGLPADSLALIARVDWLSRPPRWRAEIRRSANGQSFGDAADVLIGDGARIVVLTQLGSTPFDQHALARDSVARATVAAMDGAGRRRGAASGRITERDAAGKVRLVMFRRAVRGGFDDALLNPGGRTGSRNLLASNVQRVGDQRNASVVATAGARGVDRVSTPRGVVPVTPDSIAVMRMEQFSVGTMALEEFLRGGKLGAYKETTP